MFQQHLPAHIVQPDAGTSLRIIADVVTFKAVGEDTGGTYSLFETRTPPNAGAPPHYHRQEHEAFYVLEGKYAFRVGDENIVLGPGGYVMIPREMVHAYRNIGEDTARMLILATPGGYHEHFFLDAGDPVSNPVNPEPPTGPPDFERVRAAAARHDSVVLAPPAD